MSSYFKFYSRIVYKHTPHGVDVYPQSAAGTPFTAAYIAAKGDPIANLQEDLAADKKGNKCNSFLFFNL